MTDLNKRAKEAPNGTSPIHRFEIEFAIPTYITSEQRHRLHLLLDEIVREPCNQPLEGIHWVSGAGAKVIWREPEEPLFDDRVYSVETTAREFLDEEEQARKLAERTP